MRKIKLMADYHCSPLWEAGEYVGNIPLDDLNISNELRIDLENWAKEFDSTLNSENPKESGFQSKESEKAFYQKGEELARRLNNELKDECEVTFKQP